MLHIFKGAHYVLGEHIDVNSWYVFVSGYDHSKHCVVEHTGSKVEPICGSPILDNHSVNLLSNIIMAMLTPRIAIYIWGQL